MALLTSTRHVEQLYCSIPFRVWPNTCPEIFASVPPSHIVEELKAELRNYEDKAGLRVSSMLSSSKADAEHIRTIGLEWVGVAMQILDLV